MTGTICNVLEGHTDEVVGARSLEDGQILSWSCDKTLRLWDAKTGVCRAILKGHTDVVDGALLLPDGQILSWAWDKSLRMWDASAGECRSVLMGHMDWVTNALVLSDGRILSRSRDKTLRLWDAKTGACLEVVGETDLAVHHQDWFYCKRLGETPQTIADGWCADATGHTARLFHRHGFTSLPAWQAESSCQACLLQPDGTLVVTQANGQVCILKLHHGSRRVTLAEAEEILRAGGK